MTARTRPGLGRRLLAAAVLAVLGALAAGAAPALASGSPAAETAPKDLQTYGIAPANAKGPDKRVAYVYSVAPGGSVRDRVALVNYTTKPLEVTLYSTDAFTGDDGTFGVLAAADRPEKAGRWTGLEPRTVTIPARSRAAGAGPGVRVVPFTLKVPKNASPGDYAGGIVASTATSGRVSTGSAVVVDRRVGARVYVRVSGELDPRLEIQDLRATYAQSWNPFGRGTTTVTYRVVNTGNVALSATQDVRVSGLVGLGADGLPLDDVRQVLPGDAVSVTAVVPGTWPTVRGEATVNLEPYDGEGPTAQRYPIVSASVGLWLIPWALLALIGALILAAALYRGWRSRRAGGPIGADGSDDPDAGDDAEVPVPVNDAEPLEVSAESVR